jgi:hypothetical protein
VDLTDLVVDAGVEEDALGRSGLTGIDVRHDADIPDLVEVGKHVLCHGVSLIQGVELASALEGHWYGRRRRPTGVGLPPSSFA